MKPRNTRRGALSIALLLVVLAPSLHCGNQTESGAESSTAATGEDPWDPFALLLIDVQNDFWKGRITRRFPHFPANVRSLLALARSEGIEVIHLRARFEPDMSDWPSFYKLHGKIPCIRGTRGEQVLPFAAEEPGERVIYKHSFDAFYETELDEYLRTHGKKYLLIAGIATDVCLLATSFSAFQRGYLIAFVEDSSAGALDAHRFIASRYDRRLFESISSAEIIEGHARWMERIRRLEAIDGSLRAR